MMTDAALKSKVETILGSLPLDGQEELADYLDFLADKYQIQQKRNVVALEGVWKSTLHLSNAPSVSSKRLM